MTGKEHNDEFYVDENGRTRTRSNRSGGVQGGKASQRSLYSVPGLTTFQERSRGFFLGRTMERVLEVVKDLALHRWNSPSLPNRMLETSRRYIYEERFERENTSFFNLNAPWIPMVCWSFRHLERREHRGARRVQGDLHHQSDAGYRHAHGRRDAAARQGPSRPLRPPPRRAHGTEHPRLRSKIRPWNS